MGTLGAKRLIKTSVAPPSSDAQGTRPTCHTLDTPLHSYFILNKFLSKSVPKESLKSKTVCTVLQVDTS